MRRAVFLDRDGTLIELVHHLTDPADVRLIDGAADALARLSAAGFMLVIVTNQSVIGRGLLTEAGLEEIHDVMHRQLADLGAAVDGVYFCPLAPGTTDPTVVEDPMRKPGPGMLFRAADELDLDLANSWLVGDTVSDMLAGRNAGCSTVLVRTGYGARYAHDPVHVDFVADDLATAAALILEHGIGKDAT